LITNNFYNILNNVEVGSEEKQAVTRLYCQIYFHNMLCSPSYLNFLYQTVKGSALKTVTVAYLKEYIYI